MRADRQTDRQTYSSQYLASRNITDAQSQLCILSSVWSPRFQNFRGSVPEVLFCRFPVQKKSLVGLMQQVWQSTFLVILAVSDSTTFSCVDDN